MELNGYLLEIVARSRLEELQADAERFRLAAARPASPPLRILVARAVTWVRDRLLSKRPVSAHRSPRPSCSGRETNTLRRTPGIPRHVTR